MLRDRGHHRRSPRVGKDPRSPKASSRRRGGVGGNWGNAQVELKVGGGLRRKKESLSFASSTSSQRESAQSRLASLEVGKAVTDGTFERQLVDNLVGAGGIRADIPKSKISEFTLRCRTLRADVVVPILLERLESKKWQRRARSIVVINALVKDRGCASYKTFVRDMDSSWLADRFESETNKRVRLVMHDALLSLYPDEYEEESDDDDDDDDDPWSTLTDESLDEEQETVIQQEVVIESEPVIQEDTVIVQDPVIEVQTSPASGESTADILLTPPTPIIQPDNVVNVEPQENIDLSKVASDAAAKTDGNSGQSAMTMAGAIEWYTKALFLMEDKKYKEALSCFDKALPGSAEDEDLVIRIINGRGHAFYYLEDYPKCIESYHQAMVINPSSVRGQTLYNMGTAYAEMERFQDAIKCFEQATPRGLSKEESKLAKEQIRRCKLLVKEQQKRQ